MDFKFERICVWVKILIRCSQDDYAEVFGVIADLCYRRVNEGRVVIDIFQGYQQSPSASSRRVAYRERGEILAQEAQSSRSCPWYLFLMCWMPLLPSGFQTDPSSVI